MGLVMIYVAYQLQFSMGVLRLFALLFQGRGFSFPRNSIVSFTCGGFVSIFYLWVEALFPFVLSLLVGCSPLYCIFFVMKSGLT